MHKPEFPQLETPRLLLRELDHGDAPALLAIHQNAAHMRYWGAAPFADLSGVHDFVASCRTNWKMQVPTLRWALQRRADGAVLGTCGLFNWDQRWQKCTLGYELDEAASRQGFMREALSAVLAWGYARGELHRVEAVIHPENAASIGLAQQLGFQIEGPMRQVAFWSGKRHDMLQLSLLQPEFQPSSIHLQEN